MARMRPRPSLRAPRGLSLIELLMFIGIVSVALAVLLRGFVQATTTSADPLARRQALAIAESLLEEVSLMPFTWCDSEDPAVETAASAADCSTAEAAGPEAGETRTALPSFDHVGDYHGLSLTGITDLTGTAIPALSGYGAAVTVAAADLHTLAAADGEAVRITVVVTAPDGQAVTLVGYRSRHAPNASL